MLHDAVFMLQADYNTPRQASQVTVVSCPSCSPYNSLQPILRPLSTLCLGLFSASSCTAVGNTPFVLQAVLSLRGTEPLLSCFTRTQPLMATLRCSLQQTAGVGSISSATMTGSSMTHCARPSLEMMWLSKALSPVASGLCYACHATSALISVVIVIGQGPAPLLHREFWCSSCW